MTTQRLIFDDIAIHKWHPWWKKNTMRSCWFPDSLRATSHLKTPPRLEHDPFSFGFLAYFQDRNVSFTECWVHVKNIGWIRWFYILKTKMETEKWWLEDYPFLLGSLFSECIYHISMFRRVATANLQISAIWGLDLNHHRLLVVFNVSITQKSFTTAPMSSKKNHQVASW